MSDPRTDEELLAAVGSEPEVRYLRERSVCDNVRLYVAAGLGCGLV
jgi:hypothetical protein